MSKLRNLVLIDLLTELALLAGAVGGFVLGLSYAKRTGKELRADLKKASKKDGYGGMWQVLSKDGGKALKDAHRDLQKNKQYQELGKKWQQLQEELGIIETKKPASKKKKASPKKK